MPPGPLKKKNGKILPFSNLVFGPKMGKKTQKKNSACLDHNHL